MKRIPHRIFTAEFKREAIKLVTEHGLTLAEAGRNWTLPANHCAPGWISKSAASSYPALAHQSSHQMVIPLKLARVRSRIFSLKMEEILHEAITFFRQPDHP